MVGGKMGRVLDLQKKQTLGCWEWLASNTNDRTMAGKCIEAGKLRLGKFLSMINAVIVKKVVKKQIAGNVPLLPTHNMPMRRPRIIFLVLLPMEDLILAIFVIKSLEMITLSCTFRMKSPKQCLKSRTPIHLG